ncbi:nicotinate mononucleotide-dependent phosphoribosyltransferase CobT [Gloeobacter kilaueensis]|uniref:UPF0284 protein GKIL_2228 n=1 Tax=Gloeobacter kilaueensis (strain ATCC BAA-2537 / CCAP 1431/1 / ULC 316 / JS1) TaxID=1183438 RepID=U5QLJ2_GLOK1|nr:TIGR00303 family protein [Gloeobacter kilaueensis]AGY58474.1 hypothetical protein GKIL_2228 [Gloeobacter kilaueensis JS1]
MVIYSFDPAAGRRWIAALAGVRPAFACVLGFTATCLIPGISAAGLTPEARRSTAAGDALMLLRGETSRLPTAPEGYPSPVIISRAVVELLDLPVWVLDAGLVESCSGAVDLGGAPARCLSSGSALDLAVVEHLFEQGLHWGERLASAGDYLAIGECVAGGTTSALAVLCALGYEADGLVNSSHPTCNHDQKRALVEQARARACLSPSASALEMLAALGDPAQPVIAGMAIAASGRGPVLLAGGTQMLAIAAVAQHLAEQNGLFWRADRIAVGTTRWVASDPSADAALLAQRIGVVPLIASELNFACSRFAGLRAYERGYVKEGVGAGGLAIAAELAGLGQERLLERIEQLLVKALTPAVQ